MKSINKGAIIFFIHSISLYTIGFISEGGKFQTNFMLVSSSIAIIFYFYFGSKSLNEGTTLGGLALILLALISLVFIYTIGSLSTISG